MGLFDKLQNLSRRSNFLVSFLLTSGLLCGMCLCCKGGAEMARISIEELYRGEGGGGKYGAGGIMGAVMQEVMIHGVPNKYDERTYIELLIVKHTLNAAEQMKTG